MRIQTAFCLAVGMTVISAWPRRLCAQNVGFQKTAKAVLESRLRDCPESDAQRSRKLEDLIRSVCQRLGLEFTFKASFDKANRTSVESYRGPGLEEGLRILRAVKAEAGIQVTSDIHEPGQAAAAAEVLDVIQIPALLCRQTDLLLEAGRTGKPVNLKKGQFMAPWDMRRVLDKVLSTGNERVSIIERGTTFGYNNLVLDFRAVPIMKAFGVPVIVDCTHAVQAPAGAGAVSSGDASMIPVLARAAIAAGADGVFLEVHDNPKEALSDGPNSLPLKDLEALLCKLKRIEAACEP